MERHRPSLRPLIKDFGDNKVIDIARILLEGRIFESELRAKIEFPELFLSSPARDVQRAASENDAQRSTAEALEEIASLEGGDDEPDEEEGREPSEAAEVTAGRSTPFEVRFRDRYS